MPAICINAYPIHMYVLAPSTVGISPIPTHDSHNAGDLLPEEDVSRSGAIMGEDGRHVSDCNRF
jgi:hypothetical protein